MDDARSAETKGVVLLENNIASAMAADHARGKPGPKKKHNSRSEKISCRLTREERQAGEHYCKQHGISEAKLLRASYLAATMQTQIKVDGIAHAILGLIEPDSDSDKQRTLKEKIGTILRKSGLFVFLILLGIFLSSAPTVARYFLNFYELGKVYIMHPDEAWIVHDGDKGWEVVPQKWTLPDPEHPDPAYMEFMKRLPSPLPIPKPPH